MKKIKCELCGYDIDTHQINKHKLSCGGLGPRRFRKRIENGRGRNWSKGLTKENNISLMKVSESLTGKSTGIASSKEKEISRKNKISLSMKGNKNGATSFRRKNIFYRGIHFKSNWEANVAYFFDQNKMDWKYENITYSLSDLTSYTPDYSIYEDGELKRQIEVKGYFRKENKEKFERFLNLYPEISIEIWDKKVLLSKKICTCGREVEGMRLQSVNSTP